MSIKKDEILTKEKKFLIGLRIKQFRDAKGYTVKQLSEMTRIGRSTLSEVESQKHDITSEKIEKLIRHTDLNPVWLLTGEGEMSRPYSSKEWELVEAVSIARVLGENQGAFCLTSPKEHKGEAVQLNAFSHSILNSLSYLSNADPKIVQLVAQAAEVLTSENEMLSDALAKNIKSFAHALEKERRLEQVEKELDQVKERMATIEKAFKEREASPSKPNPGESSEEEAV
jgi:transcriptional regulator with XRE-family HTH domain